MTTAPEVGSNDGLGPAAWAVMAHGRVRQLVAGDVAADDFVRSWRESDPNAAAVPLYALATIEAQVAAERERWRPVLQALADAADAVGVRYFDTDDMCDDVQAMQAATINAREVLRA